MKGFLLVLGFGLALSVWARPNELPVVDISGEASRQFVIAEGGKAVYQGHPTLVGLADGRMIAVWTDGHGGACGPAAESSDGGKTWQRIDKRFPGGWRRAVNCPSIYELEGPDGKKRLWVWAQAKLPEGENPYDHGIRYRYPEAAMPSVFSEDGGLTWREHPPLGCKFQCVMAFSSVVRLKDGSYLGAFHVGPGGKDRPPLAVWTAVTKDGGFTWSEPRRAAFDARYAFCEPCLIRSPGGDELAMLMRENTRSYGASAISFSVDEGQTWSEVRPTPWGLTGDRHASLRLKDGRYLVAMRDRAPESKTGGQFVAWVGSWADIREGRPGQLRMHLLRHYGKGSGHGGWCDTGYSGLVQQDDGTVVAVTYGKYFPDERQSSVAGTRFAVPLSAPSPRETGER